MPDYRDNYQRRRPPQRPPQSGRRYPYDGRPQASGGYVGDRRRRDAAFDDQRRAARFIPPERGEYLADSSQDRYAERAVPAAAEPMEPARYSSRSEQSRNVLRQNARQVVPLDEPELDFDADNSFDEDDEWFTEHRISASRPVSDSAQPRQDADMFTDDFDDEPEDTAKAYTAPARTDRRPERDWFEEDASGSTPVRASAPARGWNVAQKRKMTMVICCGVLALLAAVCSVAALYLNRPKVDIMLDTVLNEITLEQAQDMIAAHVDRKLSSTVCNVSVDGSDAALSLSDCEMTFIGYESDRSSYYVTNTSDATGELQRTEYAVCGTFRYNRTALLQFLDSLTGEENTPAVDPYFEIDYETGTMTVYSGTDGWGIDTDQFISQLNSALMAAEGDTLNMTCTVGPVSARPLDAGEIYRQAHTQPANAYTTTDSTGETIYHTEINGVDFSQSELEQLIAAGGTQWSMQVNVTYPEVNIKDIKKYTFPDVLATYYTYYNAGNRERSHNLALAAEHINTLILEPGQQFSFNDTVGERTKANGFKIAGVYSSEGTAEDYGGGICQTSSTLYYTCILANLQIDDRSNHMYTVSYMTTAVNRRTVYGNDATVNWGITDFKFTNSKEYPIRIDIWAKDGVLTCEIRGTADGSTADFEYEVLKSEPYKIKYLVDDGSANQNGQPGYSINVYRVIYQDGVQIDRVLESKNTYKPMNKIFYTNDLPEGYEYGVEYDQNYTPTTESTESASPDTTTTTASSQNGEAAG